MKKWNLCLLLVVVLGVFFSMGCSKKETLKTETLVVTVDDNKIYMDEMMYHVMLAKMQGELYASFLGEGDFWDKEFEPGVTMADQMKQFALDNAIKYEILYEMALNDGYSLTDEEKADSQNKTDNILETIPSKDLEEAELTTSKILAIQEKIALSSRYYEDYLSSIDEDKETAKEIFESNFDTLKKEHKVSVKQKVWKNVTLKTQN